MTKCEVKENNLRVTNPALAAEWHPEKNGELTPEMVKPHSNKKAWWVCAMGHEWEAIIANRVKGNGCPYCAGQKAWPKFNDMETTHPELAAELHPTKNGDHTTQNTIAGASKKLWWKCKNGHEWQATGNSRVGGKGCPYCSGRNAIFGETDLVTTNPNLAAEWHPAKNGDLTPEMVTAGSHKKVWWQCDKGHEWQAVIHSRITGNNCPVCSGHKVVSGINDLATLSPGIASEWHFARNGKLTPNMVSVGSGKKVWWKCRFGHEWKTAISNRNHGTGCPKCYHEKRTSFPEKAICFYVSNIFPDATASQHFDWLGRMELDVFIPSLQIAIEYDGVQWHDDVQKDLVKNTRCIQNGIRLIRVREPGCPQIEGECINLKTTTHEELEQAIRVLLWKYLQCDTTTDVNVNRDYIAICELIELSKKENSLAANFQNLTAEWHPTKNGNLTPEMVSSQSNKNFWWQCGKGHEWQATVSSRSSGSGCPYCSGRKALTGFNDLAAVRSDIANEWHPTRNGNLTPQMVTVGSTKRVWWQCAKGHEWKVSVVSRSTHHTGCPICAGRKPEVGYNDLLTLNPNLSKQWHPTKNGNLTPEMVTAGSGKRVWWLCDKGHSWQATVADRSKHGCPYCSGNKVLTGSNDLATKNPTLAAQWHPTKNGDLMPRMVSPGSHKKVWWKCKHGHEWDAIISNRSKGIGCPYCSGRKAITGVNDLCSTHPKIAAEWHPAKNGNTKPNQVSAGSEKKVWWQCEQGHEQEATICARVRSNGCPYCSGRRKLPPTPFSDELIPSTDS